ncbi:hypothetical protein [Thiorhodococcus drewsii]|uniref:hypothetical protein n=1 Tax=Thiorhodococcus drewsii TaxID=210408 RepID=UPI001111B299|nr:hypothetical protein [Thiorhodococcus drewsii]
MNLATLRVEGTGEALEAICDSLNLEIDNSWKEGEERRRGGYYSTSGFNTTIVDAENPRKMVAAIRAFLVKCRKKKIVFSNSNLSTELAIGVTVGEKEQYVACVDLPPSDLMSLAELGISLSVAAYPASDEDD